MTMLDAVLQKIAPKRKPPEKPPVIMRTPVIIPKYIRRKSKPK